MAIISYESANKGSYTISCVYFINRSSHSVKHYRVFVENGDLLLGKERFSSLESLEEHFDNHPILGEDNGKNVASYTQRTKLGEDNGKNVASYTQRTKLGEDNGKNVGIPTKSTLVVKHDT